MLLIFVASLTATVQVLTSFWFKYSAQISRQILMFYNQFKLLKFIIKMLLLLVHDTNSL